MPLTERPAQTLSRAAVERLTDLHLEEFVDNLYSLRLNNTHRIIGIRDRQVFQILWWDPDHKVCPSAPKNT